MSELVGDCASDPPLSATARALACSRADDVVYGLGLVALARDGSRPSSLKLVVRHDDAESALRRAVARVGAHVEVARVADAWPAPIGPVAERLDARVLVAAADGVRGRPDRVWLSVAGAVGTPVVLEAAPDARLDQLVTRAGGALVDDWVAVAGGAPGGRLVERDARVGGLGALVLVLPARHPVVGRLRTSTGEWLTRAASACEGCRLCTDGCPAGLRPHDLVWTLATGRDDGVDLRQTTGCTGCALCDVHCPASLSPARLVVEVRDRLARSGPPTAPPSSPPARCGSPGLDLPLLTLRLGLGGYRTPDAVLR